MVVTKKRRASVYCTYLGGRMSGYRGTPGGVQGRSSGPRMGHVDAAICILYSNQSICRSRSKLSVHYPWFVDRIASSARGSDVSGKAEVEAHRSSRDRSSFVSLRCQGSFPQSISTLPSTPTALYIFSSNQRYNGDQFHSRPSQSQFIILKVLISSVSHNIT
jgi:hypothetical protein